MNRAGRIVAVTINPSIDLTVAVPNFTPSAVNRVQSAQQTVGGKGNNVASFLADYGFPVAVTGFLGSDNDRIFHQYFLEKAISDRFIRIPGQTRFCVKVTDPARDQTTDINLPGLTPTPAELDALFDLLGQLKAGSDAFVLSGSLPPGVPASVYRGMAALLEGRLTAVDTSGEALRLALAGCPALIKPNLNELEELTGARLNTPAQILAAGRDLSRRHGIRTVVISMGREGAILLEGDEAIRAVPPPVAVKTTVGAGDALLAGVLAGKLQGLPLAGCARLGTAFAAHAVSKVGAGLASAAAVEAAAVQVQLVDPLTGDLSR